MAMSEPEYPEKAVNASSLAPHCVSVMQAVKMLGPTRQALNNLVNGHCGINPEMAIHLATVFGGEPEDWLRRQMDYDLALAKTRLANITISGLDLPSIPEQQARLL